MSGMTPPLYDSRAMTEQEWLSSCHSFIATGWQYLHRPSERVIYLRKHISGALNTESEGWEEV